MRACDPGQLTATERKAEIAELLAKGYLRLQISAMSSQNSLAEGAQPEASCGSHGRNPKSQEHSK